MKRFLAPKTTAFASQISGTGPEPPFLLPRGRDVAAGPSTAPRCHLRAPGLGTAQGWDPRISVPPGAAVPRGQGTRASAVPGGSGPISSSSSVTPSHSAGRKSAAATAARRAGPFLPRATSSPASSGDGDGDVSGAPHRPASLPPAPRGGWRTLRCLEGGARLAGGPGGMWFQPMQKYFSLCSGAAARAGVF